MKARIIIEARNPQEGAEYLKALEDTGAKLGETTVTVRTQPSVDRVVAPSPQATRPETEQLESELRSAAGDELDERNREATKMVVPMFGVDVVSVTSKVDIVEQERRKAKWKDWKEVVRDCGIKVAVECCLKAAGEIAREQLDAAGQSIADTFKSSM